MEELAFSETGYFTDEYERIFISHFGKSQEYERIITVLSWHPYGLFRAQIAERADVDMGGCLPCNLIRSKLLFSCITIIHSVEKCVTLKQTGYLNTTWLNREYGDIGAKYRRI